MRVSIVMLLGSIFCASIQAQIPTSARSRTAIQNQTPGLQAAFKAANLTWGNPIFIRLFKVGEQHEGGELEVWVRGNEANTFILFRTYPIYTYGSAGLGPKIREGDGKAPEGFYFVNANRLNPYSRFHLSFNLGYPNRYDRYYGRTGGYLMVHGSRVSIGCYAMTDPGIEEIYTLVEKALRNGQGFFRVHAFPFKLTQENLDSYSEQYPGHAAFWQNLKEGYDYFETQGYPPNVEVQKGRYIFE